MQKKEPDFGKGCYVDLTPLPNGIDDNPFNALCCHGVASSEIMIRLILVLVEKSGLPVWYDIIPCNVLDINTVMTLVNDVADSLGIEIESLVLDAGYIFKELVGAFHIGTEKTIIGRCQSLMCFRNNKGSATVETPSKQVKESYKLLHTDVLAHVDLDKFRATVMEAKM